MTFKNAPQNKPGKPSKAATPSTPAAAAPAPHKPVLGVNLKGELRDVPLALVIDPQGPSDRTERPGDAERIAQMAASMAEVGQLQPVMLEELADGRFCRVFGRRRIAAARLNGMATIRAVVVPPLGEDVRRTVVAVENVQRQDLTPPEETLAVAELIELVAFDAAVQLGKPIENGPIELAGKIINRDMNLSRLQGDAKTSQWRRLLLQDHRVRSIAYELVAAMLAKPASWVRDRAYIGRLSEAAQKLVREGKLPLAHAREIAKVADSSVRDELAKDYAAGGEASASETEPGLLADLQEEVRRRVFSLHVVRMKQRPLSDLQQRVLKAIGEDWTLHEHVHEGCGWGRKGCRRSQSALLHVLQALLKRGAIQTRIKEGLTVYRTTHAGRRQVGGGA